MTLQAASRLLSASALPRAPIPASAETVPSPQTMGYQGPLGCLLLGLTSRGWTCTLPACCRRLLLLAA